MNNGFKTSRGFSIVEIMIAVALFGIIAGMLLNEYGQWLHGERESVTVAREQTINDALSSYVYTHHALPCPADPDTSPLSPTAGMADCTSINLNWPAGPSPQTTPPTGTDYPPNVTWPYCMPAPNGLCVVNGARATANNPTFQPFDGSSGCNCSIASPQINDPVLIGTLPYIDLGISMNDTVDGWGNRMTYAVSYYDTDPNTFDIDTGGAINVEQYDTAQNKIVPMINKNLPPAYQVINSFMYVVLSAGPNGRGAWNYNGIQTVPCDMTPIYTGPNGVANPSPSTGRDNENCNNDSTFLQSATGTQAGAADIYSMVPGPYYYDDAFVMTSLQIASDEWIAYSSKMNKIENKGGGYVGIGTNMPTAPLDVNGNVQADNIQSDSYKDANTGNVFYQSLFLGPGKNCNNEIMTGIAQSKPICAETINIKNISPSSCTGGNIVTGFSSTGGLICSPPP